MKEKKLEAFTRAVTKGGKSRKQLERTFDQILLENNRIWMINVISQFWHQR